MLQDQHAFSPAMSPDEETEFDENEELDFK